MEAEAAARSADQEHREELAERFDEAAEALASFGLEEVWDEATADERRTIIEDLLGSVLFYPDQLMVQALGRPTDSGHPRGGRAPSWYQNGCVGWETRYKTPRQVSRFELWLPAAWWRPVPTLAGPSSRRGIRHHHQPLPPARSSRQRLSLGLLELFLADDALVPEVDQLGDLVGRAP